MGIRKIKHTRLINFLFCFKLLIRVYLYLLKINFQLQFLFVEPFNKIIQFIQYKLLSTFLRKHKDEEQSHILSSGILRGGLTDSKYWTPTK